MAAPEIRIDQLTGLSTLLAPGRARRPDSFSADAHPPATDPAACPFCEGNEDQTPPEVFAIRPAGGDPDSAGWKVRSVPNLYPALDGEASDAEPGQGGSAQTVDPLRRSTRDAEPDMFSSRPARGAHEVVISAPRHVTALAQLEEAELARTIEGWRARMAAHTDAAQVQLIVNEGGGAGASLEHSHAQLYGLPFVPVAIARERERVRAYWERTGGSDLITDILVQEIRRRERLVAIDDDAALICPWASHSPFELRIVPRRPAPRFEEDSAGAGMLATALRALRERFGAPPELNLWIRTAPRGAEPFTWHIDLRPRLTVRAGFELSTEVDINVYPPEAAAADLRESLGE